MNEIKFIYNNNSIIEKFCKQNNLNKSEISFILEGKILEPLKLKDEMIDDKSCNKKLIFVFDNNDYILSLFKSKYDNIKEEKNPQIEIRTKEVNEITIIYKINNKSDKIQIFGKNFVKNN